MVLVDTWVSGGATIVLQDIPGSTRFPWRYKRETSDVPGRGAGMTDAPVPESR